MLNSATPPKKPTFGLFAQPWFWVVLALITFGAFPLYRYIKKQLATNSVQDVKIDRINNYVENQDPTQLQSKADKITTRKDVQKAAKDLAVAFGTKYSDNPTWSIWDPSTWSALDPRGWTENDADVYKILAYQRNNYDYVARLYHYVYTPGMRNLGDDIRKYLDTAERQKLAKIIKF